MFQELSERWERLALDIEKTDAVLADDDLKYKISRRGEPMPVITLTDARVPIECKNGDCGVVHLYLVRDLVPNYSIPCLDCRRPIDLSSDQWTDAVNATVNYYKAIIL